MRYSKISLLLIAFLLLSACTTTTAPPPNSDGPILTGFNALPKAVATVFLSPTPDQLQITPSATPTRVTATPAQATRTPSFTPMVGVFMGAQTYPAVEGTLQWIPTHGPRIIILTARPGTKPPAPQGIAIVPSGSAPIAIPVVGTPVSGGVVVRNCPTPVAGTFANFVSRNQSVFDRVGCPRSNAVTVRLVFETFQTGAMVWRDTKEIYVLGSNSIYFRVADSWNDTIPASDPGIVPPNGLQQPVRGFGYVWRSNPSFRNALGWATGGEMQIDATWQDFERGFLISGSNGAVYALVPTDGNGGQYLAGTVN